MGLQMRGEGDGGHRGYIFVFTATSATASKALHPWRPEYLFCSGKGWLAQVSPSSGFEFTRNEIDWCLPF